MKPTVINSSTNNNPNNNPADQGNQTAPQQVPTNENIGHGNGSRFPFYVSSTGLCLLR